jgi:hypothetical protein
VSSVKDAIRDANRLSRMRQGQSVFEYITLPSLNQGSEQVRLAQVVLTEAEVQQGIIAAISAKDSDGNDLPDSMVAMTLRNRIAGVSDAWHSLRVPDHLDEHAFESIEQMVETLPPNEVDMVIDQLAAMMDYASPSIDGLTDKDLDDLKKDFVAVDWSGLTGPRWAAVKQCCQILLPDLLQAKLSGSSSTDSSTPTSASDEST